MRSEGDELRDLGTTGRRTSPIGLGLAAIGRPGYLTLGHRHDLVGLRSQADLEAHAIELLDEAWWRGVTYFDAARSYGMAEAFVGGWLRAKGFADDGFRPTIGSKWGYTYTAGWRIDVDVHEVKELSRSQLDRHYGETNELLGDFLDLYQIHSATIESGVLDDDAVIAGLADLRDGGTAIGLSTTGPGQAETIRRAIDVAPGGSPLFATVQATWNLLEPSAGPALAEASDAGLGVIVKEAMANGRLAGRDPRVGEQLRSVADDHGLDQLAIGAALAQPWAAVVLSGAATIGQLRSNLGGLDAEVQAVGSAIAESGELAEAAEEYWEARSELPWT